MSDTNATAPWLQPVTLTGRHVRLEPLAREHVEGLQRAAADGELWKLWYTSIPAPDATAAYVDTALALQAQGLALPFVVRDANGEVVGSTRFGNVDAANVRVEIGWTWYAQRVQRSHVNTACKLLLFDYAFESLKCKVVGLRTDNFNFRSQRAIEVLGAKKDGVIRHHWPRRDGTIRDSVMYSVLVHEWPDVKRHLEFRLKRNETH